ncbi:MAG: histidine kinase dimerization/phospho-acceptor domain-containing protein [Desulfovibrionales bacterium]
MRRPKSVPLARLSFFKEHLGISPELLAPLNPYRDRFAARKDAMADFLYSLMNELAQTQIVLRNQTSESRLKQNWQGWYSRFWGSPESEEFLSSLWLSGTQHVSYGVDHRFISLAYSQVRRFTSDLIEEIVPLSEQRTVQEAVDRLFDLCQLVETDAYIEGSSRCEWNVMSGVAHQLRNPLTVIGGTAALIKRAATPESREDRSGGIILEEALRLERLVSHVTDYLKVQDKDPTYTTVDLEQSVTSVLERIQLRFPVPLSMELHFDPEASKAEADQELVHQILTQLLENSFEAMSSLSDEDLRLSIRTGPSTVGPGFLSLTIENSGELPESLGMDELFTPFHTANPMGTGFGLPIALLAARKNFGTIDITRLNNATRAEVLLLRPGCLDESRLFFKACKL